ncbi:MAG TPA: ArdC family protein [Chloroflexota bacterium]
MSESTATLLQTVREGLQALADELAAGKSERLCAVLDFASRFHRYSLCNQALIQAACPTATYVAGYRTWQKLGYQVRKGERGIRILAPRPYTRTSDDGEEEQRLSFAAVAVFDAGQLTETPALPSHRDALPDDQQERYAAVLAAVQAEGIRVEERDDLGSAEGYSAGGVIALRRGLDSRNRTLILLHEWAHELLHKGEAKTLARERKEAQAEATAYVVSRHFGLAHPFAADYLQSWRVLTPDDLERELDAVVRAAGHIIDRLEAGSQNDAGADVAA